MLGRIFFVVLVVGVTSLPQTFETKNFKVGIEYDHSLPMVGGADRYRHRNNYDPFFVTVTATAKKNYVISYLEVTATVDALGAVDFCVTSGATGSRSVAFRLASNRSEFLAYSYLAYGIREDEYKKVTAASNGVC
ncbi:uncharacterized protein LOC125230863 [Leguminivora glycinivorella]|uniref:uncharacterized protein LOC125230863 n=1 Tax=Leguminivora glycinivorella TaxID=1035111 RepID=UPI00200FFF89|nr:uncharacterized protein LOC125230863 [Leguminivora glycinivorella]